jgi:hypothetical protein
MLILRTKPNKSSIPVGFSFSLLINIPHGQQTNQDSEDTKI